MTKDTFSRTGLLLAGALMLSTLAGCSHSDAGGNDSNASAKQPDITIASLPGEWARSLDGDNQWLTVGEITGVRLVANGETRSHLAIRAEYLDQRDTDSGPFFVTLDSENSRPLFLTIEGHGLEKLTQEMAFDEPVEGLCLYQDQALYLFILSERQRAHQFLVQRQDDRIDLQPVRTLPIPPESTDCVVDDHTGTFYVAESGVGVWAHGADPESELARTPVVMTAPFGRLPEGPQALAMAAGRLLVLAGNRVVTLNDHAADVTLTNTGAAETLTAHWEGSAARVAVFNEDTADYRILDLPVEPDTTTDSTAEVPVVTALAETDPVPSSGDAADDPAIWVNRDNPAASRILGTNKRQGLHVYDLEGHQTQSLPVGRLNNVDVRYGVPYRGRTVDIAVASNRTRNSLSLFAIQQQDGLLLPVTELATDLTEIYGLCLYQPTSDRVYAFVNDKSGRYLQYRLDLSNDQWGGEPVREFTVDSQPEGCVADDQRKRLFVGEEGHGIWVTDAEPQGDTSLTIVDTLGDRLTADVEGLSLYGGQYLVASSQGNNRYAVYEATPPYKPVGVFGIGPDYQRLIDGVSETDGLAVSATNLGDPWDEGLLVVQDGRNVLPQQFQNFKLVPWQSVRQSLALPVRD